MTFPWTTEAQRRRQREGEDFARRAVLDLSLRMAGVNPLRENEADGMADILRRQGEVNVLRPARSPFRIPPHRPVGATERLERFFRTGYASHD